MPHNDDNFRFAEFPLVGLSTRGRTNWNVGKKEISFSEEVQDCCVCFIDLIGSTKISSDLTPNQLGRYYELFLNAIALIARNFDAKIVKNAGDALIFYFNDTSDPKNVIKFKNVLECGLTMGIASNTLNAKMLTEKLPPVQNKRRLRRGFNCTIRIVSERRPLWLRNEYLRKNKLQSQTKRAGYWRDPI
jgi:class 3 adenylate cyclase